MTEIERKINENLKLTYWVINRYFPSYKQDCDIQEIALIGLWKAIKTFDVEKGYSFSSYARAVIKNEILVSLRQNKEIKLNIEIISLNNTIYEGITYIDSMENPQLIQDLYNVECDTEAIFRKLNDNERKIVDLLLLGKSQSEIAKLFNYTRSSFSKKLKNIRNKILATGKQND